MRETVTGELSVRYFIGDNNATILNRLADEIEGLCGTKGFVIPGTTKLTSRSAPFLDRNENGGITRVLVRYEADIVKLEKGDTIDARVVKVNRLGAMTEFVVDDCVVASVLLPCDLQEDSVVERMFHRDHVLKVQVLDLRFGVGWDKITAVGRAVGMSRESPVQDTPANDMMRGILGEIGGTAVTADEGGDW